MLQVSSAAMERGKIWPKLEHEDERVRLGEESMRAWPHRLPKVLIRRLVLSSSWSLVMLLPYMPPVASERQQHQPRPMSSFPFRPVSAALCLLRHLPFHAPHPSPFLPASLTSLSAFASSSQCSHNREMPYPTSHIPHPTAGRRRTRRGADGCP